MRNAWLLPALLVLVAPVSAGAQERTIVDSVLVLGPTSLIASFDIYNDYRVLGDSATLSAYGIVSSAHPPIALPANAEITCTVSELEFSGSALWDKEDFGGLSQEFQNGIFRMFEDETPDASLSDLATYSDGTLLLEGTVTTFWTGVRNCLFCPTENGAVIEFTGGSLFPQVSRNGIGYTAFFNHRVTGAPIDSTASGYGYRVPGTGSLGLFIPVSAERTTWGKIKRLYH